MSSKREKSTIPPTFDLAKFARDSDAKLRAVSAAVEDTAEHMRSEVRIATKPGMPAVRNDEAWARTQNGVPALAVPANRVKELPLDHKAGFLLSLMDGATDLATLVEVSAMDRDEVLRIIRELQESGVVEFR